MSHVKDMSKNEILEAMVGTAMPTSPAHEQQKAGIIVRCTEDIEKSIKSLENQLVKNADASDRMGGESFLAEYYFSSSNSSWCCRNCRNSH